MISVPVIRAGAIQGYVMAQFSFTAEGKTLKQLPMKADVVVIDEAFKAIYSDDAFDFRTHETAGPDRDSPSASWRAPTSASRRTFSKTCSSRSSATSTRMASAAARRAR